MVRTGCRTLLRSGSRAAQTLALKKQFLASSASYVIGVLFLDELPEFNRPVLEALRQPLETGRVTVARAQGHVTYPARFQLIAAMNPCRCGHLAERPCGRAPRCAEDYQARLSGPLIDRIDLHIDVPSVSPADLALPPPAEGSTAVARLSPWPARGRRRAMPRPQAVPRIRTN